MSGRFSLGSGHGENLARFLVQRTSDVEGLETGGHSLARWKIRLCFRYSASPSLVSPKSLRQYTGLSSSKLCRWIEGTILRLK
jgi:hypothetical protein